MNEQIAKTIARILKKEKNVAFAYLFGSTVKRPRKKHGDTDIAIMLGKELRGLKKLEFINRLASKIEAATENSADIVILNRASAALKHQVIKYGRLLFERKKGTAKKFIVDTITAYLDYLEILKFFHARTVKKGVKHG